MLLCCCGLLSINFTHTSLKNTDKHTTRIHLVLTLSTDNITTTNNNKIMCISRISVSIPYFNLMSSYNPLYYSVWEMSLTKLNSTRPTRCIYTSVIYATIGSDNGLPTGQHQAITWPNAGLLLIDQSNKSHNAPVPYPTIHDSEQKCAHFCSEWCVVGYGTGALWD